MAHDQKYQQRIEEYANRHAYLKGHKDGEKAMRERVLEVIRPTLDVDSSLEKLMQAIGEL